MNGPDFSTRAPAPAFDRIIAYVPSIEGRWGNSPTAMFVLRTIVVLLLFVAFDALLGRAMSLPGESYQNPLLVVEVARAFGSVVTIVLALGFALVLRWGAGLARWGELQHGLVIRAFVVFLCLLTAWPFVTHGYNYYYDQGHLFDRALIVALLPLLWWRPVFVLPFLVMVYAMMGQLVEPSLGGTILAHKLQLTRAIGLFGATFVVHALTGERRVDHYVFLTCCLVAAAYWIPAVAKIRIDWTSANQLFTAPLAAYAHGWLGHLSTDRVVAFAHSLTWVDPLLRVAVIIIEAACLLFLAHRRITIGLLVAVIVFHFGVFMLFGFLFWTWIGLDAALLVLLLRGIRDPYGNIHYGVRLGLSVALILAASWWAKPPWLGWYETPLNYVYRIDAITSDGESHRLHPRFFAPYEDVFTMASFSYLVKQHPVIVGPYGVTHDRGINDALGAARSAEGVFEIEKSADSHFDEERAIALYRFLERFVTTRNSRGDLGSALYTLHSPLQFWSQVDGLRNLGDRHVTQLIVTEVTTFYDGNSLDVIREIEVGRMSLSEEGARQ